jgi:hypothetical protein
MLDLECPLLRAERTSLARRPMCGFDPGTDIRSVRGQFANRRNRPDRIDLDQSLPSTWRTIV